MFSPVSLFALSLQFWASGAAAGALTAPAAPPLSPEQAADAARPAAEGLASDYVLPFSTQPLALSEALDQALDTNLDLALVLEDVGVSESSVLAAQGAFDVTITAGVATSLTESPQRGSTFVFSTGSRDISGYAGLSRRLETGGNLSLRVDARRGLADQPVSFFAAELGTTTLATYSINPTLTLTHPLLRGMGIRVNRVPIERAQLAQSQSEAQAALTAQNMVRDIVSAYWDVLFASRDLENKVNAVALAREQLERTRAQVEEGRLAPVELKAVEQSVATREQDVLLAENTLLTTSLNLRTLLGDAFTERELRALEPSTDPELLELAPVELGESIDTALQANPQVRQLQLALSSRRLDELEAANQRLVQLDFTGSFAPQGRSTDTAADPNTGSPERRGSWREAFQNFISEDVSEDGLFADYRVSGQLDLTWAVQNRSAKGNHARTLAELRKAEMNLQKTRQTITTAVIRSANSIRSARKRIEVAELSIELAEENLAAEQARFDVGRATNYDVLQRIDEVAAAQVSALSARIEYLKARAELQALTGEILPAYGLELRA